MRTIIGNYTDNIPDKGPALPDVLQYTFFDWLAKETQSHVEAAQAGRVERRLLERDYRQDYVDRKLSQVLHDRILWQLGELKRDLYDCEAYGRIYIETRDGNQFAG